MTPSASGIPELFYGVPGRPGPAGHVLTIADLASIVRVHPNTVRNWIDKGDLAAFKTGTTWKIVTDTAIAFLEAQSNGSDSAPDAHAADE
jgi:excisionase family DNA binding protein